MGNELKTIPIYLYMIINLTGLGRPDTLSASLKGRDSSVFYGHLLPELNGN